MPKMRINELAKELNKTSTDVIVALKSFGVTAESNTSMLSERAVDNLKKYFYLKDQNKEIVIKRAEEEKPKAPAPKPKRQQPRRNPKNEEAAKAPEKKAEAPKTEEKPVVKEAPKAEAPKAEAPKVEAPKVEAPKAEAPKAEAPKAEAPKAPEKKVEAPKAEEKPVVKEAPKAEAPKVEAPKTEAPKAPEKKAEAPKAEEKPVVKEAPKAEAPKAEAPKAEAPKAPEKKDEKPQTPRNERPERAPRDNEGRQGNFQRRDGEGRQGNFQRRDGEGRQGNFQRRDGEGRQGNFQRRDGEGRQGNFQRRDGEGRQGGFQRRDNDGQGGFQRRDGEGRQGGFQRRDNDGQNGFQNRPRNNFNNNFAKDKDDDARPVFKKKDDGRKKASFDSAIATETKDNSRENRRKFSDSKEKERSKNENQGGKKQERNKSFQLAKKSPVTPPAHKPKPVAEKPESIILPETLTIKELADKMVVSPAEIIKKLFMQGKLVNLNSDLTYEEAEEIAMEYEILCEHEVIVDVIEEMLKEDEESEDDMITRPPVVCVMGHVDHGKTSILDAIRKTSVTSGEAGGITQHIGAYTVNARGQQITFLDTPGHEAFTSMRLRGALATDIAILVVAADDGVMPQTIEAINHAKAAGVDIIIAINKIDKPAANIDRVKQELTEYELVAEDWGGQTVMVPVSAKTGEGLEDLLDMILLTAEVKELKANPNRNARGLVLEAKLDKGRGPVATVLVQKGTLHVGDNIAVGVAHGKVRAMIDDKGRRVKSAGPADPVEILGLNDVPQSGDIMVVTDNDKEARSMAETFIASNREKLLKDTKAKLSLDSLFDKIQEGNLKELNLIVKADVQGSVEAVKQSLVKLSNDEVIVKVIHGGVGAINESDVILASASNAIIIGFNVRPDAQAKAAAELENVDLRLYRVIYNAIEDVEAAMKGLLDPVFEEKVIAHAEVRALYKVSGVGTIIGGYVLDGKIERGCKARLLRENVVIYDGALASLKRFKDDVKEVNSGYEFGTSLEGFNDIKEFDILECYNMVEVAR